MPDRAVIPVLPAAALGFLAGLIAAALQLEEGTRIALGAIGAGVVLALGLVSVVRCRGEVAEKTIVGVLRGGCAAALFVFLYVGVLAIASDGRLLLGVLALLAAGAFGLLAGQLRVRAVS